jgi:hypothetical protein
VLLDVAMDWVTATGDGAARPLLQPCGGLAS